MQPAARNLRLFPWYLAFTTEGISSAVWYLFLFSYKGLSLEQMAWLVLLGDGIIVLAEIPTGWLADRLTRRASILCGIVLQAASALLFLAGRDFWQFCLAMAVCGLGDTFRSGADQALLYDSCLVTRQAQRFRQLLSHSLFVMTLTLMASQIAGGFIATYVGWELVFWLEVGFSACGFAVVWQMREPARAEASPGLAVTAPVALTQLNVPGSMHWLWLLLPLTAFATITGIAPELAHFYLPAELNLEYGLAPVHLGFLFAAFELMQGWGNKLAGAARFSRPAHILPWLALAMTGALALFGLREVLHPWSAVAALALYLSARSVIDFLYGLSEPLLSAEANRRTPSANRATALSVVNAARRVIPLLLLPLAAWLSTAQGNLRLYAYLLPAMLVAAVLTGVWLRRSARQLPAELQG